MSEPCLSEEDRVPDICGGSRLVPLLALAFSTAAIAQQTATSGTFVLHKFAKAIGTEAYSTDTKG